MSYLENLPAMRRTAGRLLDDFLPLFDRHMRWDGEKAWLPYGSLPTNRRLGPMSPDEPPSSRLSCDVALGYLAAHLESPDPSGTAAAAQLRTACGLLRHAFRRQHPRGWFVWNYGQYEIDQVDLGTVLDTYYYFWTLVPNLPADVRAGIVESTRRAVAYLQTAEQPDYPGIIQKRAGDPDHPESKRTANYLTIDVLNGNALAATAYCRGAAILGEPGLLDLAARYQRNLVESFGRHAAGWWAYIERLGTRELLGPESLFYQAMTALYLEPLYRARPNAELASLLAAALSKLAETGDAAGGFDWSHESRKDFIGTPALMASSAAAALADLGDITDLGRRRLEHVERHMYDYEKHWFLNDVAQRVANGLDPELREAGQAVEPASELFQIWTASDLALIILYARRAEHGLATRPA